MTTFDAAFDRLLGNEGGYSNNPRDPGGATNHGVTQRVARAHDYRGDMRDYPQTLAREVYCQDYWTPCRADDLPEAVRYDVFDGAVNSGVGQSVRWLQRAAGAEADGTVGPATLKAVNALPGSTLVARYNGHRLMFMAGLSNWDAFSEGWARRVATNLLAVS